MMNGAAVTSEVALGNPGPTWQIKGTGDFNGDGKSDILWQNNDGTAGLWMMNGAAVTSEVALGNLGPTWHIEGTGDFSGYRPAGHPLAKRRRDGWPLDDERCGRDVGSSPG